MIDRYWPELEWDFQTQLGLRAMDWIAGEKDWREFYRLKSRFGMGTAYFNAVANDPEVAAQLAEEMAAKGRSANTAPSSEGWFPWKDDVADLKDHLTAIRGAITGAKAHELSFVVRPEFEFDRIRRRKAVKKLRAAQSILLPHKNIQLLND